MKDQWIEWMQEKQRHFFYGVALVVATVFVAFQIYGRFHKTHQNHFFVANQTFENWLLHGEAFDKLEKALEAHPHLETKFGAMIADRFIAQGQGDKAEPFAENVLKRVHQQTPEHATFSEGSLLIAKGKYQEALDLAVSLKDRLEENSLLYGFNLIRIASLYRVLEIPEKEIASMEELENFMETHEDVNTILSECFSEGELTLKDYLSERKRQVKN